MCMIVLAYRVHPQFPLVVAANRDEFHERPTTQAGFWNDHPEILAGRDLECMGTWMGVTRRGRFAAVTNYRDPTGPADGAASRGTLVSRFLAEGAPAGRFMEGIATQSGAYRGFNLLASDGKDLFYYSNRSGPPARLEPGVYGLSNHLLDTPWPKVEAARKRLEQSLLPAPAAEPLLALLADTTLAAENDLPKTGVAPERERMLSAARIVSSTYGTRSSTVLMQDAQDRLLYAERSYGPDGAELDTLRFEFRLDT